MLRILLLILAIVVILLSVLQGGKSQGITGAFSGQSSGLFSNIKERGPEKVLSMVTMIAGILFFVILIIVKIAERA